MLIGHTRAERQLKRGGGRRRAAQSLNDFLTEDVLGKASPDATGNRAATDLMVRTMVRPALRKAAARFADQPQIRASLQQTLADVLVSLGRPDMAIDPAAAALATRRAGLGDGPRETVSALACHGNPAQRGRSLRRGRRRARPGLGPVPAAEPTTRPAMRP